MKLRYTYSHVQQHDQKDCGIAVISNVLKHYGKNIPLIKIRQNTFLKNNGINLLTMKKCLESYQFNVKVVKVELEDIDKKMKFPMILHCINEYGMNHFVVLHKIRRNRNFIISDPAKESIEVYSESQLKDLFSDIAVLISPKNDFERVNESVSTLSSLFRNLIVPQKKLLISVLLSSLFLSVLGITTSFISKVIIDEYIPLNLNQSIFNASLVCVVILIIQSILSYIRTSHILYLTRKVDIPLILKYYRHILYLPIDYYYGRQIGDITTRFQDALTVKELLLSLSVSLPLDIVVSMISAIYLMSISGQLFLILVVSIIIQIIIVNVFKKSFKKINEEKMVVQSKLNSHIIETFQNIETIKSMNDEYQQFDKLEHKFIESLKTNYREGKLNNIYSTLSSSIPSLGSIVFLGVGSILIMKSIISFGELIAFQSLSQYFVEPIQNIISFQLMHQDLRLSMNRLSETFLLETEDSKKNKIDTFSNGDIKFENVIFSYDYQTVLNRLNLNVKQGTKVAIVGESGAGKSTIARLLMKYMENYEGEISISGSNIKDYSANKIRQRISYIPQGVSMFSGTIYDNLKIGNSDTIYEAIINSCKKSGADQFIRKLPQQYFTHIEEGGKNLSSGQQQRIAIARALARDSDIYIFDEISSNLDPNLEKYLNSTIFNELKGKTIIIITHRLTSLYQCDCIFYLENGQIVEQGTHDVLMNKKGRYAAMYKSQNPGEKRKCQN
ncbi:peptidase domain-containing ABC transporter [Erysipelothrix sp. HDW6A]|uniref:peptidase domain-containing ABC transporter n=1 Tax=Erysipelothrix sp. HDW6A TaxID=2714928 RepID=UPI001F0F83EC|nr:peptidase domain-containing ABC transporter [Erysipelothrix sp. HDW6A]